MGGLPHCRDRAPALSSASGASGILTETTAGRRHAGQRNSPPRDHASRRLRSMDHSPLLPAANACKRIVALIVLAGLFACASAHAEKRYGPGATDTEIKLGQTMPYSGPLSAFGTIGRAETAYFEM